MTKQLAVIREGGPLPFSRRSQGRPHFITHDARTDLQSTSKMLSVLGRDAATGPGAGRLDVVQEVTLRPAVTTACRQMLRVAVSSNQARHMAALPCLHTQVNVSMFSLHGFAIAYASACLHVFFTWQH